MKMLDCSHPRGLLKFVTIHILGPLCATSSINVFVVVSIDRCSKYTRTIPSTHLALTQVDNMFSDICIIPYTVPDII